MTLARSKLALTTLLDFLSMQVHRAAAHLVGLWELAAGHSRQVLKAMSLSSDTSCNHLDIKELAKVLPADAKAGLRLIFVSGVPSKAHQYYVRIPAQDHILSLCLCPG